MSRLIVMLSVSLDGFFEGPGGDISWHHVTEELHRDMNAVLGASGGLLNGRRNWELMSEFWPDVDAGEPEVMQEFSAIWNRLPQHVFSTTLESVGHGATLHRSVDVVPRLKAEADGDLYAGGGTLAAALARRGWVDGYVLHVCPVVLGAGSPLFAPGERQELRLTRHKTYPDGVIQLHYETGGRSARC
ncbi:MAG TPA: dihydrofolate reductase family protein [Mycobacteriales bacterium]|nr:dihydrofolate reductase family protein [Mycobacteriales bacterium]